MGLFRPTTDAWPLKSLIRAEPFTFFCVSSITFVFTTRDERPQYLRDAGLMAPHEAVSAAMAFVVVLGISLAVILLRLFGSVVPRKRRLAALLAQYRTDALTAE